VNARWVDDAPAPRDAVDDVWDDVTAERDRFVRALGAWAAVIVTVAVVWLLLRAVEVSEAAGAWLGLLVLMIVVVTVVGLATRRGGAR
jgi:cell division protein FtsW (lipid II flippase)